MASATIWIDDLKSVQGLTRLFVDRGAQLIVLLLLLALGLDSALILTRWSLFDAVFIGGGPADFELRVRTQKAANVEVFGADKEVEHLGDGARRAVGIVRRDGPH